MDRSPLLWSEPLFGHRANPTPLHDIGQGARSVHESSRISSVARLIPTASVTPRLPLMPCHLRSEACVDNLFLAGCTSGLGGRNAAHLSRTASDSPVATTLHPGPPLVDRSRPDAPKAADGKEADKKKAPQLRARAAPLALS